MKNSFAAQKNSDEDSANKRGHAISRSTPPRVLPFIPRASSPQIQRNAACACGGDCPRCQQTNLQPKLTISQPEDLHEVEADRIAEQVMRAPSGHSAETLGPNQAPTALLQRKCNACQDEEPERKLLRRKERDRSSEGELKPEAAPLIEGTLVSQGQPLQAAARNFFEPRFARDFSDVRVHTDAQAAASARAVNAEAYTIGRDVVFAKEKYQPQTEAGRRLIAHELTHVLQQERQGATRVQRKTPDADADKDKAKAAVTPGTAGDAPKLTLDKSAKGSPCACLIVIHNNERNARQTAQAMHQHCSYNLLLLLPDDSQRRIHLPGQSAKVDVDPNELFPPKVAEDCLKDEQGCRDFVKNNSGSKKKATAEEVVEKQFFLAIKDCSESYSLPVVGLHNNVIEDTAEYRKKVKSGTTVTDLKLDIDKTDPKVGEKKVQELKDLIDKKFGTAKVNKVKNKDQKVVKEYTTKEYMTEVKGKTNIFRWCASNALNKCHIGDPEHPDNVVWVTNDKDFETLRKKDVNVALQNDLSKALGTDAETDLSTVFLVIKRVKGELLQQKAVDLDKSIADDIKDMKAIVDDLKKMLEVGDTTVKNLIERTIRLLEDFIKLLIDSIDLTITNNAIAGLEDLRFINIETQDEIPGKKAGEVRAEGYDAIINVLKAVGLHCCGDAAETATAEKNIKEGLKK
ncbi:MAG TPA: DUF4157 domain-containing protein [Pyrinomonadaceae bacterium]